MTHTTSDIQDFLHHIDPFDQLSETAIATIANQCQIWRYRMGQVILMRGKLSSYVTILLEGQGRLLGYDPRTQMPSTLQRLQPGSIVGDVNLVRGVPCETVIASTEAVGLALREEHFWSLLEEYPRLKEQFQGQCSLSELYDLLGTYLAQQAQGDINIKALAEDLLEDAQVYYLEPGKNSLPPEHQQQLWLVSGGGTLENFKVGNRLISDNGNPSVVVTGNQPVRVIILPLLDLSNTHNQSQLNSVQESSAISLDKVEEEIPYADVEVVGVAPAPEPSKKEKRRKSYPFVKGKTPLGVGSACFQMLSQYFGMPYRRDVIRRILAQQLQRTGTLSLPLCGAITELMGLNAQLIKIPASSFTQLKTPALLIWQDSLAILYDVSDKEVVVAVPELGILRRSPREFLERWGDTGEVLLLQPTKETPQQRFGLSWFIPALRQYRRVLAEVFIASFFVQLFGLANPLMIQVIIDKVIVQNSADTLQVLGTFLLIIAIFEAVLTTLRTYLFVDTTNRIDMSLGSEIIDHLLRLPLRYFERRPVGEISTRVNELENIRQFLTGTALTVVLDAVFSVVYIAVMIVYSPLLTLVALGIVPIFVAMTLVFSPTIRRQLRTKAERNAQTQSYLVEVMSGIQTVKAQNIELRSRWQWQEKYARYVSAGFNTVITSTLASSTSGFLNKLSGLLVLWVGAYLVLQQELSLGQLIAFRIIASYVTSPILRLTQLWQNFQETALSLERLADIVDTPQEAERDRSNIPMPAIRGAVKYENVSFRFKQHGPLQLKNINIDFPAGTFIAVVGGSGAGKSTLTKLISRLYEPEAGRILIDGYDISKVELYSLRRQVGVVPQETLLFEGSVQDNIALTNPDATTEEIIEAATVAAAHEFIMTLPNGYNTNVGERGSALSGGQRQRIAIARSVLQNPQILVLDEATSALDYATEQQVCLNLLNAFSDRTVFFITHRLGTIRSADVILMMDSGSVVEQGTHDELMALKGRYYYLYQQQEGHQ
ncbi:toxin secretion ABC transporter ATP-binding protein, HlyB family [Crocosphaera subtropica ATCC 51142]|uniref:Toxin secretion ABC transporter ATP-binding protein, HlyB family n=1 Tax=Crocosphaera subtropica (strain ATCC 51142 / BH68) TaxID=43989 RepID=B1WQJ4_CROS5|nr:peptidase domain-containing ABC transporter [Crocosphaera subtropica]ACB51705.1 toxin secretion ABC transporter ATP-binding protein, HlyB family [Crocosphaera subtropica ATCC 51142]